MKKSALFTIVIILFSSWSDKNLADNEIIELPIEIVAGYGPFEIYSNLIDWRTNEPESEWAKTEEKVIGIPDDWNEMIVKRIWFDLQQFAFQSYKQGTMSEEYFTGLVHSWNMDLEKNNYSSVPIKCYTHIALGKTDEGNIIYKIDTDNDKNFSDEIEFKPFKSLSRENLDSLSLHAHKVSAEIVRNDKITNIKIPVLIWENEKGMLMRNFPFYAQTKYQNIELNVSTSFCHTAFYKESSLCFTPPYNQKVKKPIQLNQLIEINGERFKNLGVDINKGILKLEKIELDTKFYSNQVGSYAKEFSGMDFLTNESKGLKDYSGKYLLLDFWGTWCKPCIMELPNLKHAYQYTNREKLDFLSIAHDRPEALKKYLQKDSIPWNQIISTNDNNIVDTYEVLGFPTTFLIDPEGKIIAKNLQGENLLDTLNHYLE